jgi:antirestriction protein ArdC
MTTSQGSPSAIEPNSKQRPETTPALQKLEQALETACTAGGWWAYLTTQARFYRYSFRNLLMIQLQNPDATRVAGFHDWLKLGRHVRKGERGLAILAPMKYAKLDADTGETQNGIRGFRTVYVFDIAQTEGTPLPELPQITITDGPNPHAASLTAALTAALERDGIPVRCANLEPGHHGSFNRQQKTITLANSLNDIQRFSTLAHETAHAKLHAQVQPVAIEDREQARALREFEAESVAFVVLEHYGIGTLETSAHYLASYGATPDVISKIGSRIQSCAAQILETLETTQHSQPPEPETTPAPKDTAENKPTETSTRLAAINAQLETLATYDPLDFWDEIQKLEQEKTALEHQAA